MSGMSLNKILKEQQVLKTDIGDFSFMKSLGEGGNSFVFLFKKENKQFAIKFLKPNEEGKLKRFKDEYFCAMQIATHKNVVKTYHFDSVLVRDESYYIIAMKHYQGTLHSIGNVATESDEVKGEKGWKLFCELANALDHLHKNKIIHRDLKPLNIFFDEDVHEYVIGDLGIAHFSAEQFPKESKTQPSEKLANFSFSPSEQGDSKNPPNETMDIYSLGQVLNWYLTGELIRGLGRPRLSNLESPKELQWLDSIIDKCLNNDPKARFQSIAEISLHVKELKNPPKKDYWKPLHRFDDVIRRSFPSIDGIISTSDSANIERFFFNFNSQCEPDDFRYMTMDGGDNSYQRLVSMRSISRPFWSKEGIKAACINILGSLQSLLRRSSLPKTDCKWLFCGEVELDVSKLIVYRDDHYPYKNFFILLISPSRPFDVVDSHGHSLTRNIPPEWASDFAVYWNGRYIDSKETQKGYYEIAGDVIPVDRESFSDRSRHLYKYAYIVVPQGTATAVMSNRSPTENFLKAIVEDSEITESTLEEYLDATKFHHSKEITMWN